MQVPDQRDGVTKREQVAQFMRERIECGEWRPRCRIPSQSELADTLNVSIYVVARATADLRERGYVATRRRRGSYARPSEDWRRGVE